MSRNPYSEEALEEDTLETLAGQGWDTTHGIRIAPGSGERQSWDDLILHKTLATALRNLNPTIPEKYLTQATVEVLTPKSQDPISENHRLHDILINGYRGITYVGGDGTLKNPTIRFVSADPSKNRYLAVNQVMLRDRQHERRFDIVLYVNGLPLVVVELKRAGSETVGAESAFNQLQTYVDEFPLAFSTVALVVASDGVTARYGTPFTPWNHFANWNVDKEGFIVEGKHHGKFVTALELLIIGLLDPDTLGLILRDFITFSEKGGELSKIVAKPHQFFAVQKAVDRTLQAVRSDGRAGVVWHTQGSGKSLEMELYTAKVMRHGHLANPTVIVITDRTELDDQLFESFAASTLLPESPRRIVTRAELRELLSERRTGGIYFTTLQKFGLTQEEKERHAHHPLLSDRRNIIVIVDEAHRSHYDNIDGYAAHLKSALPGATMIAFTGTPIAEGERDTRRVFGDDIDTYDLLRAVEDGATVPVSFEPRLIRLNRDDEVSDDAIDDAAEEATEALDEEDRNRLQRSVAVLNTVYGAPERVAELAADLVSHWERRSHAMEPFMGNRGKAMVVCATRVIAAQLYEEIIALRPDWHDDDHMKGKIKVVYTASPSDSDQLKKHMRRPSATKEVKQRLKDEDDELEMVIVKDMMLTGFDAPALHTIYLDRPLKGALLMQTLARVNRTYRGKQDGLLVAYAPIEKNLGSAMQEWTKGNQAAGVGEQQNQAMEAAFTVLDTFEELDKLISIDWRAIVQQDPRLGAVDAVKAVTEHLRSPRTPGNTMPDDPQRRPVAERYKKLATHLARNYAIASGIEEVQGRLPEIRFYEEVRVWLAKLDAQDRISRGEPIPEDVKRLLGEILVTSTESEGVIDIYEKAGVARPHLDSLSGAWMDQALQPNKTQLAIEALKATLLAEMGIVARNNPVRREQFSSRVNELMLRYTEGQLSSAEILAALAEQGEEVVAEASRGQQFDPPLDADQLAFFDLLSQEEGVPTALERDTIAELSRGLVISLRQDMRTDWAVREDVRAKLRRSIKRQLRKYGFPADRAATTVAQIMELVGGMSPRWVEEGV